MISRFTLNSFRFFNIPYNLHLLPYYYDFKTRYGSSVVSAVLNPSRIPVFALYITGSVAVHLLALVAIALFEVFEGRRNGKEAEQIFMLGLCILDIFSILFQLLTVRKFKSIVSLVNNLLKMNQQLSEFLIN